MESKSRRSWPTRPPIRDRLQEPRDSAQGALGDSPGLAGCPLFGADYDVQRTEDGTWQPTTPRQRLYELVAANPGWNFVRLRDANPSAIGVTAYNLSVLERFGLVRSVRFGRYRRYYETGQASADACRADAAAQNPFSGRVLSAALALQTTRPAGIAAALGVTRETDEGHLECLRASGAIETTDDP